MDFSKIREEALFQRVYDNAMREQEEEKSLREEHANKEVEPEVGFQPTKKVVLVDPTDTRTEYFYQDGTKPTDWLPL